MHKPLLSLAVQALWRKKRSNLLLFVVLMLFFAFTIAPLTITESIRKANEEFLADTYGGCSGTS